MSENPGKIQVSDRDDPQSSNRLRWVIVVVIGLLLFAAGWAISKYFAGEDRTGMELIQQTDSTQDSVFGTKRESMVENTIIARGVQDEQVIRAMQSVLRHEFVLPEDLSSAYADHPLPIGYGQTISQPYVVAWMTELLELQPGEKVLEIGTGSGYQAAVLAEIPELEIYSIEIVPELAQIAAQRLEALGYTGIHLRQGDGYYGWEEAAPFDAIIVTAAPDHLPAPLVSQLAEGGRIVIPIGPPGGYQSLWKFVLEDGELKAYDQGMVTFVRFTGEGIESPSTVVP
jgi:protein-L-isoaspartate(D-aspartate) O-methyltransferase